MYCVMYPLLVSRCHVVHSFISSAQLPYPLHRSPSSVALSELHAFACHSGAHIVPSLSPLVSCRFRSGTCTLGFPAGVAVWHASGNSLHAGSTLLNSVIVGSNYSMRSPTSYSRLVCCGLTNRSRNSMSVCIAYP